MNKTEAEKLKKWFEANYLDGDIIQEGQMIASSECFEVLKAGVEEQKEEILAFKGKRSREDYMRGYAESREKLTEDHIQIIQSFREKISRAEYFVSNPNEAQRILKQVQDDIINKQ